MPKPLKLVLTILAGEHGPEVKTYYLASAVTPYSVVMYLPHSRAS